MSSIPTLRMMMYDSELKLLFPIKMHREKRKEEKSKRQKSDKNEVMDEETERKERIRKV